MGFDCEVNMEANWEVNAEVTVNVTEIYCESECEVNRRVNVGENKRSKCKVSVDLNVSLFDGNDDGQSLNIICFQNVCKIHVISCIRERE